MGAMGGGGGGGPPLDGGGGGGGGPAFPPGGGGGGGGGGIRPTSVSSLQYKWFRQSGWMWMRYSHCTRSIDFLLASL